jgi:hypothetical protein
MKNSNSTAIQIDLRQTQRLNEKIASPRLSFQLVVQILGERRVPSSRLTRNNPLSDPH